MGCKGAISFVKRATRSAKLEILREKLQNTNTATRTVSWYFVYTITLTETNRKTQVAGNRITLNILWDTGQSYLLNIQQAE